MIIIIGKRNVIYNVFLNYLVWIDLDIELNLMYIYYNLICI